MESEHADGTALPSAFPSTTSAPEARTKQSPGGRAAVDAVSSPTKGLLEGRIPKLEKEKDTTGKFLFESNEAIDFITREWYEVALLARASNLDVIRQAFPPGVTFYVDSGADWPGFEFIYLLEGQLQYDGGGHPVVLEPGCFIVRHLARERAYFQTVTDVALLHVCSPPGFHVMQSETEEFYEVARRLDADEYVSGHCKRLEDLAVLVGQKLHLSGEQMGDLGYAAFFHDIGKAKVPKHILQKPGKLTDEEWKVMKQHSTWGREMLEGKDFLRAAARIVEESHEQVDGRGYPKGLKGDEISLEARIVSVVDAYDAMTTDRTYRAAMTEEEAIQELRACAGSQFDEQVVEALIEVLDEHKASFEEREQTWLGQELTQLKQREAFLRIGEAILAGMDVGDILNDVAAGITHYTPFNRAIITLYETPLDPTSTEPIEVAQVAQAGTGSGSAALDLRQAYSIAPSQRGRIFANEHHIGRSYHVPTHGESETGAAAERPGKPRWLAGRFWNPGDRLFIPMWVEERHMIGFIGVDAPSHALSISAQMLEPIEMFANLAAIAVLQAREKQQLTEMATRDPLTDAYNRHFLGEMIEKERARVQRNGSKVSLIMADFMDFHRINVEFGHLEGDRVLKEAAGVLLDAVREVDVLVRYGGDEFLIVMPETGEEEAQSACARIRERIREHDFGLPRPLDVRVGSSTWERGDPREFSDVLEEADRWMYRRGREECADAGRHDGVKRP
jgi:diguanylate cyclase (GGDEF)-like protein